MNARAKAIWLWTVVAIFGAAGTGCATKAACNGDELARLQETCLEYGGTSFEASTSSSGETECAASGSAVSTSGECKIDGEGECSVICRFDDGEDDDGEQGGDSARSKCGDVDWIDISVASWGACGVCGDGGLACFSGPGGGWMSGWSMPSGTNFDRVWVSRGEENQWACALDQDGNPRCWGDVTDAPSGPYVLLALGSIALYDDQTCGIDPFGDVSCWGGDSDFWWPSGEQMGMSIGDKISCFVSEGEQLDCSLYYAHGDDYDEMVASRVFEVHVVKYVADEEVICVLLEDGTPACSTSANSTWSRDPGAGPFVRFALAAGAGCGILDDGEIACFGSGDGYPSGRFVKIAGGWGGGFCAIRDDGVLKCWGGLSAP